MRKTARDKKSRAFSLCIKGSAACQMNAATNMVTARKKEAGRVIRSNAMRIPPPNSESPAALANQWGAGY